MASIEGIFVGATAFSGGQASVDIPASTVQPGDVLVVVEATSTNTSAGFHTSLTGIGATWSLLTASSGAVNGTRMWVGVGATTDSGTIQGAGSGNKGLNRVGFAALIVRGVDPTSVTAHAAAGASATATLIAPAGGIAIGAGYSADGDDAIASTAPGGWVEQPPIEVAASRSYATAYREETSADAHSVTALLPGGSATASIVTFAGLSVTPAGSATLAVTTTWTVDGSVDTPGKDAAATLAVATTWAVDGTATTERTATAALGVTTSWFIDGTTTGELPTVALDNLTFTVHRPPPYHRVKVTGMRGSNSYSYDPNPRLIACAAPSEVRLTTGDPAGELWLEPEAGTWWYGDLHRPTNPRLAANTTAFARVEGSWAGGRVETDEGDLIRWATADDFTITTELVGPASVRVTLGPGAGLAAGEWFVNKPPRDAGLPAEVEGRPLPVFTAWGVSRSTIDVTGHSAPIGPSTKPDYVHDAGFACGFDTGPRTPEALAQDIATRALQPGELVLECPPDDVQVGERWRVRVDATAGLDADVVVLGRPDLTWGPGQQSMSLRVWAMSVTPT